MNNIRKFYPVIVLILAAVLLQAHTVMTYAAQVPNPDSRTVNIVENSCAEVLENAVSTLERIDIPDQRADYGAFDRIANCMLLSTETGLPITN